jgi:hypothetical protein
MPVPRVRSRAATPFSLQFTGILQLDVHIRPRVHLSVQGNVLMLSVGVRAKG